MIIIFTVHSISNMDVPGEIWGAVKVLEDSYALNDQTDWVFGLRMRLTRKPLFTAKSA